MKFEVESITPGTITLSLGSFMFSKTCHSWACLGFEASNPRHAHEWQVFENIKLPNDKVIVPGVIDSTSNFIEHEELVKNRIIQYSKVIDKDQLMAGSDCGFSTFAGFGNVDENIVYKKFESLVAGAELASNAI